jgi:hypothetical protein
VSSFKGLPESRRPLEKGYGGSSAYRKEHRTKTLRLHFSANPELSEYHGSLDDVPESDTNAG